MMGCDLSVQDEISPVLLVLLMIVLITATEKGSRAAGHVVLVPVAQLCHHEAEDTLTCQQMALLAC